MNATEDNGKSELLEATFRDSFNHNNWQKIDKMDYEEEWKVSLFNKMVGW